MSKTEALKLVSALFSFKGKNNDEVSYIFIITYLNILPI